MSRILHGDCLDVLPTLEAASFDAVVTDPPYHLTSIVERFGKPGSAPAKHGTDGAFARASKGFMGQEWDGGDVAFRPETWAEVLRVLRPGGHMVCFGGTRTAHRMVCAIEDAGFEIRDSLCWLYGSGFPKSLDVSKAIDKAGVWNRDFDEVRAWLREKVKTKGLKHAEIDAAIGNENSHMASHFLGVSQPMLPTWNQWVIIKGLLGVDEDMDRPPRCVSYERAIIGTRRVNAGLAFTSEGPTELNITAPATPEAAQWQGWGSALKPAHEPIVLARKPLDNCTIAANVLKHGVGGINIDACRIGTTKDVPASGSGHRKMNGYGFGAERGDTSGHDPNIGRWPSNVCHDGSDEVMAEFAEFGEKTSGKADVGPTRGDDNERFWTGKKTTITSCYADTGTAARFFFSAKANKADRADSKHPTVKPLALMEWLVKLITPPGGKVLDPFAGSGITAEACMKLGFDYTLIDIEAANVKDIQHRIKRWSGQDTPLFAETV